MTEDGTDETDAHEDKKQGAKGRVYKIAGNENHRESRYPGVLWDEHSALDKPNWRMLSNGSILFQFSMLPLSTDS